MRFVNERPRCTSAMPASVPNYGEFILNGPERLGHASVGSLWEEAGVMSASKGDAAVYGSIAGESKMLGADRRKATRCRTWLSNS
jgi:hypothetical protein